MVHELLSALCLVAVLEGLILFVTPDGWKRAAERLYALTADRLRILGGGMMVVGLLALWLVRH